MTFAIQKMHSGRKFHDNKKQKAEKTTRPSMLHAFITKDIDDIIQDEEDGSKNAPMSDGIADFFNGVKQDMSLLFPKVQNKDETLLHWLKIILKDEKKSNSK